MQTTPTARCRAVSQRWGVVLGAVAAAGSAASIPTAQAVSTDSIPLRDSQFKTQGLSFKGRLAWLGGVNSAGNPAYTFGLILPGGKKVLVEEHVLPSATSTSRIFMAGNGSNYFTDPGLQVGVESWTKYSQYGLGIVTLSQALPTVASVNFVNVVAGQNYAVSGFGPIADQSTSPYRTGDLRSFNMQASDFSVAPLGLSDENYALFDPVASQGRSFGISGDSSSYVFDQFGNVAASLYGGAATSNTVRRYTPDIVNWINTMLPEPGDANRDGTVNFSDLLVLAQHYGTLSDITWDDGDFSFDAAVNFPDLLILAQNYGTGSAVVPGASPDFNADWALAQSLVPEPGTLMVTMLATPLLTRRRRAGR